MNINMPLSRHCLAFSTVYRDTLITPEKKWDLFFLLPPGSGEQLAIVAIRVILRSKSTGGPRCVAWNHICGDHVRNDLARESLEKKPPPPCLLSIFIWTASWGQSNTILVFIFISREPGLPLSSSRHLLQSTPGQGPLALEERWHISMWRKKERSKQTWTKVNACKETVAARGGTQAFARMQHKSSQDQR